MGIARLAFATGDAEAAYNGYYFGPYCFTESFSMRPNLAPDKRTVDGTVFTLTLVDYLEPDGGGPTGTDTTTDDLVEQVRRQLQPNAGALIYKGRGFGDLTVNTKAGDRDIAFGPVVKELTFTPHAGYAVRLKFTVEWTQVDCADRASKGIRSFSYKTAFAFDKHGYCTRNYEATLVIAGTKNTVNDRAAPDSADEYREQCVPLLPVGFRRLSQNYSVSPDLLTLTAVVVDEQLPPNPPPEGCVEAFFEQTCSTQGNFLQWFGNYSGEYELARGTDASVAVQVFTNTLKRRLDDAKIKLKQGFGIPDMPTWATRGAGVVFIPVSASASDPAVYGRTTVKLAVTYRFAGAFGFANICAGGGLWQPINPNTPNALYEDWATSVQSTWGPRGIAKLRLKKEDSRIIDLCGPGQSTPVTKGGGPAPDPVRTQQPGMPATGAGGGALSSLFGTIGSAVAASLANSPPTSPPPPSTANNGTGALASLIAGSGGGGGNDPGGGAASAIFGAAAAIAGGIFDPPPAESSWMYVKNEITTKVSTGRVVGKTLPDEPIDVNDSQGGAWDVANPSLPTTKPTSAFPPLAKQFNTVSASYTFVQQRTRPTMYLILKGTAVRQGYEIPVPEIVEFNGIKPTLVGEATFTQCVVGRTLVGPVYRASWELTYAIVDDGSTGSTNPYIKPVAPPLGSVTT